MSFVHAVPHLQHHNDQTNKIQMNKNALAVQEFLTASLNKLHHTERVESSDTAGDQQDQLKAVQLKQKRHFIRFINLFQIGDLRYCRRNTGLWLLLLLLRVFLLKNKKLHYHGHFLRPCRVQLLLI